MKKLTKLKDDGSEGYFECPLCHELFEDMLVMLEHKKWCEYGDHQYDDCEWVDESR